MSLIWDEEHLLFTDIVKNLLKKLDVFHACNHRPIPCPLSLFKNNLTTVYWIYATAAPVVYILGWSITLSYLTIVDLHKQPLHMVQPNTLFQFILRTTVWGNHYYPHFTDEEAEVQRVILSWVLNKIMVDEWLPQFQSKWFSSLIPSLTFSNSFKWCKHKMHLW